MKTGNSKKHRIDFGGAPRAADLDFVARRGYDRFGRHAKALFTI